MNRSNKWGHWGDRQSDTGGGRGGGRGEEEREKGPYTHKSWERERDREQAIV